MTGYAQDANSQAITNQSDTKVGGEVAVDRLKLAHLQRLQTLIDAKQREIAEHKTTEPAVAGDLQKKWEQRQTELADQLKLLNNSLERLVTDGMDLGSFVEEPEKEDSDWKQDVALIAQPVLDSLKELTEKPRQIKQLNDELLIKQDQLAIATDAMNAVNQAQQHAQGDALQQSLAALNDSWQSRIQRTQDEIELANIQLANLEGKQPLGQSLYAALANFVTGRGLTLVLAFIAAFAVWAIIKVLLVAYRRTQVNKLPKNRTHYRLAAYSVHALTFILGLIAVFVVFYQRHDVLLLGLLILFVVGLALSIRNLLPQYVQETRLLLNIGALREGERVIFRGLPWVVDSINMYTRFRNPELNGELRIPLAELSHVSSRPVGMEPWFPTSKGDYVIFTDERLLQVVEQNPDTVELQRRGGQIISVPTTDFYAMTLTNLSRSESFGVRSYFGLDYDLQDISTTTVPATLKKAIEDKLSSQDFAEDILDVKVELLEAGASSLDYWILVVVGRQSAKAHNRIKRMVQAECIDTCTKNNWNIPFPHMSLVNKLSA
jgi:small-conductance mechanosensitive channel